MALWQLQCKKEGTLFYYQHGWRRAVLGIVGRCPVCGSTRIELTGRSYPELDEDKTIRGEGS